MALEKVTHVIELCIVFLSISVVVRTFDCQSPHSCPSEKRFCTPLGCVSECPDNSFENGSVCVINCGDWMVVENSCRAVCPPSSSIIVEHIIVTAGAFQKVRSCVNVCSEFDPAFVGYNGKCVRQCPPDANLIVENSCSHKCPEMYPFLWEYDRYGIQVIECMTKCPSTLSFVDGVNRMCVSKCPKNRKFVLNDTCVTNCTGDFPYFTRISGNMYCQRNCGKKLIQLQECVYRCDEGYYISDNACVNTCPPDKPFMDEQNYYKHACVSNCSRYRIEDTLRCVSKCPIGTHVFNNTCVDSCPTSSPYSYDTCVDCDTYGFGYDTESKCYSQCPTGTFHLNATCVHICPSLLFNDTCVPACPGDTVRRDSTCYTQCPVGTRLNSTECIPCTLLDLDTCVENCPEQRPYNEEGVCLDKCSGQNLGYDFKCIYFSSCNRSIQYDGQCIDSCPVGTYWASDSVNNPSSCYHISDLLSQLITCLILLGGLIIFGVYYFRFECCFSMWKRKLKHATKVPEEIDEHQHPGGEDPVTASSSETNLIV